MECIISYDNGTVIHHENLNTILFPEDREKLEEQFHNDGLWVHDIIVQSHITIVFYDANILLKGFDKSMLIYNSLNLII